jgi:[ribosomal protein S5]-alanine N-acetyltransferase
MCKVEKPEFPTLETERLRLARIGEDRLTDMFEIYSDPKIMFFYGKVPHRHREETLAVIRELENKFQSGLSIEWGMILKETGKLIGTMGFNKYQVGFKGDVGFGLNGAFAKRGFASEALRSAVRYGFDELKLHRIEAEVDPRNEPAQKLLLANGFLKEGLLRDNELFLNELCSTVVFGRLVTD